MKNYLLLTFAASSLLALSISVANAGEHKKTQAEISTMCQQMSDNECRMMVRAMVKKNRRTKVVMAEELKADNEFRKIFISRIGSDAPHEERNPSAHPELFTPKKQ